VGADEFEAVELIALGVLGVGALVREGEVVQRGERCLLGVCRSLGSIVVVLCCLLDAIDREGALLCVEVGRLVLGAVFVAFRPQRLLFLVEPQLLRADDRARPADTQPRNGLVRSQPVVFHDVGADKGARSAQPSLAVHSQRALRLFRYLDELVHDFVAGATAVQEIHVVVLEPSVGKLIRIVQLLIQPHHSPDIAAVEVRKVGVGRVERVAVAGAILLVGAAEREKLVREEPVQVAALHFLVILVLNDIEIIEVEKFEIVCFLKSL